MSGRSSGSGRRRRLVEAALVTAAVTGALGPVAACSVPREADLAAGRSAAPAASSVPPPVAPSPVAVTVPSSPTASAAPSPSASPSSVPVKPPVPIAVPGYTLSPAPRSVPNPLAKVEGAGDVFGATTVRSVSKGGAPVGLVFLFAVRPQYLTDKAVTSTVVSRLTASITRGGVPLTAQRFGTQRVCAGSSAKNGTIALWYTRGVLTVVVGGGDGALVTGYARALAAAS